MFISLEILSVSTSMDLTFGWTVPFSSTPTTDTLDNVKLNVKTTFVSLNHNVGNVLCKTTNCVGLIVTIIKSHNTHHVDVNIKQTGIPYVVSLHFPFLLIHIFTWITQSFSAHN